MKTKENKGEKKGEKRLPPVPTSSVVSGYLACMPVFRRLERVYRIRSLGIGLLFLLAYNGSMTPYNLMMTYHGYNVGGNGYRSLRASLSLLRDKGLVLNGGGKWWLTDAGKRAIRGED